MYRDVRLTFRDIVRYTLLTCIVVGLILYALWQARLLIIGPVVAFTDTEPTLQHERTVILTGYAANITNISLNGRTIYTDKEGNFKEALVLENGYTVATVTGTDRYGRTTALERTFVYQPLATTTKPL